MDPGAPLVRADLTGARDEAPSTDAQVHAAVGGEGDRSIDDDRLSPNVIERTRYRQGDADGALAGAAVRVRRW